VTDYALDAWQRAVASLETAKQVGSRDPDSAASRAYYAAFHAISALFALREKSFSKHAQLRAAVHRDLIHTGEWEDELGSAFDYVWNLRRTGDYGGKYHVTVDDAAQAIDASGRILQAVLESARGQLG
jgi:uncharacterized protein (UPF0332 family)